MPDKILIDLYRAARFEMATGSSIVDIDGIGAVCFTRSRRARRIIISVSLSKGVRVSVPWRTSFHKALEFVDTKKEWIQKHLAIIEQNEKRKQTQGTMRQTINKDDARKTITERLSRLAKEHGFIYYRVTLRQQKTRWGSCSPENNISLNIKLVLLPETLLDYVLLHELVHTRIHNHSRKFWAELDKYVVDSKVMAKRLRMNEMMLL
jgi:predicted metal-dependent hydrolase